MAYILIPWIFIIAILSGIGFFWRRAFGLRKITIEACFQAFWLGYAFSILVLQIWHLWFKVDVFALVVIVLLGIFGLVWNSRTLYQFVISGFKHQIPILFVILIVGFWLSNRATGQVGPFDAGLYHLQLVMWFSKYPLIPGLGNLHGRFAFNNSHFLYAALLDVGPWAKKSYVLTNGALLFVLITQVVQSIVKMFKTPDGKRSYYFFQVLFLATIFGWVYSEFFVSVSPDLPIFCLGIILSGQVFLFRDHQGDEEDFTLFFIAVIAIVGITIKLSFLVLGLAYLFLALGMWIFRNHNAFTLSRVTKVCVWVTISAALLIIPWIIRGIWLSGYIAYPLTIGSFQVPWRIPTYQAREEANAISNWARYPGPHWTDVIYSSEWVKPWLERLPPDVTIPITLSILAILLSIALPRKDKATSRNIIQWLFLLPPILSLVFWFSTAPDPRFAGAAFWIIAAGSTAGMVESIELPIRTSDETNGLINLRLVFQLLLFYLFFIYVNPLKNPLVIAPIQSRDGLTPIPKVGYEQKMTDSGFLVNIPVGNTCWLTPLPCLQDFVSGLYLLKPGNIRGGFKQQFSLPPSPVGFQLSPDLSVRLASGWLEHDSDQDVRWMKSPSKFFIYTEKGTPAILVLKPLKIYSQGELGNEGRLKIKLNSGLSQEFTVHSGEQTEIPLQLDPGFNLITIENLAGNMLDPEDSSGNAENNEIGVGFYPIEIKSVLIQ